MDQFVKRLQSVGIEVYFSRDLPIYLPNSEVEESVEVAGQGEDAFLRLADWVGKTPSYIDPSLRRRDQPFEGWDVSQEETRSMLAEFIQLVDAPTKNVGDFAEKYGLLRLCVDHGLPFTHDTECDFPSSELISHWRRLAKRVRAILAIAADLRFSDRYSQIAPKLGSLDNWASIDWAADPAYLLPNSLEDAKGWLANYIDENLEWSDVRPHLHWSEGKPTIEFRSLSRFSYIAVQLLYVVGGVRDLGECIECGKTYPTPRLIRTDRRNYCPDCRSKGVPDRDSKRDLRLGKPRRRYARKKGDPVKH